MTESFQLRFIHQNDLEPPIEAILTEIDANGAHTAVDLSGIVGVKFQMGRRGGPVKINADANVVDATGGVVKYEWQDGDTDTAGDFECTWQIEVTAGRFRTFPQPAHATVSVVGEIA